MTEFCVVEVKCGGISSYLIWCTDESDYFLAKKGTVVHFSKKSLADKYCVEHAFGEPSFASYDFDSIDYKNCNDFLGKWNIIDDLAKTLEIDFVGSHDEYTNLYAKFVYGSNLPALNTSDKKYVPVFDKEEQKQIETIINAMIEIVKHALEINISRRKCRGTACNSAGIKILH